MRMACVKMHHHACQKGSALYHFATNLYNVPRSGMPGMLIIHDFDISRIGEAFYLKACCHAARKCYGIDIWIVYTRKRRNRMPSSFQIWGSAQMYAKTIHRVNRIIDFAITLLYIILFITTDSISLQYIKCNYYKYYGDGLPALHYRHFIIAR